MSFRAELHRRAARLEGTVALAEWWDPRVREAAQALERSGMARVVWPARDGSDAPHLAEVARRLAARRPDRVRDEAHGLELAADPLRYAAGLVALGLADAAVAGADRPTADVIRAALWLVGPAAGTDTVSSAFYMVLGGSRVLTFTDAGVVPDPSPEQLAEIALGAAADRIRIVGDEPAVAFLSYSTKGSADGPRVAKVVEATERFRRLAPEIRCDGELQGDAALVPEVARRKAPDSAVAGLANVLVFPDLDSGNIAYKLVQRLAGADAIGPIIQGLERPVADLSRGATPSDIVDVAAVALLQSRPPAHRTGGG